MSYVSSEVNRALKGRPPDRRCRSRRRARAARRREDCLRPVRSPRPAPGLVGRRPECFAVVGGIAQLVEHLHGMQRVRSSSLLVSTFLKARGYGLFSLPPSTSGARPARHYCPWLRQRALMSTGKRRPSGDGAICFHKKSGLWAAQLELPRGIDDKRGTIYAASQTQLRRDVADLRARPLKGGAVSQENVAPRSVRRQAKRRLQRCDPGGAVPR